MDVRTSAAYPQLPPGFRFGTSTAAYQIEGAAAEDGRGPSIWDTFATSPATRKTAATATSRGDHYHRHAEDVGLCATSASDAYRFSIAWPRVLPNGPRHTQ